MCKWNVSYFVLEFMHKIKLIGLMSECIVEMELSQEILFKENITVIAYLSQI